MWRAKTANVAVFERNSISRNAVRSLKKQAKLVLDTKSMRFAQSVKRDSSIH